MKTQWLDRALIVGPFFALCTSESAFKLALNGLKVDGDLPFLNTKQANATTHFVLNQEGERVCLVCIGSTEGRSGAQIAALLVHEAVHIWQDFRDHIGEKFPSDEFEAYSIQTIAQRLLEQYADQVK